MEKYKRKEKKTVGKIFSQFAHFIYIHGAAGNLISQISAHNKFRNYKHEI
jgi:hypothetical protein